MSLPFFTGQLGIAQNLEVVLGRPDQSRPARWGPLVRSGTRTGQEFNSVWTKLVQDGTERADFLNQDLGGSILGSDSSSAGGQAVDGSTRTKTTQLLESLHYQVVLQGLKSHPSPSQKPNFCSLLIITFYLFQKKMYCFVLYGQHCIQFCFIYYLYLCSMDL